jgi:hypothetical protein
MKKRCHAPSNALHIRGDLSKEEAFVGAIAACDDALLDMSRKGQELIVGTDELRANVGLSSEDSTALTSAGGAAKHALSIRHKAYR